MRFICFSIFLSLLVGCGGQHDDLEQYIVEVKQRKFPVENDVPEVVPFEHLEYIGQRSRDPFESPKPELLDVSGLQSAAQCKSNSLPKRKKQALEQYGLDNLAMRGSMREGSSIWALIQTPEGEMFQVREGHYMGLNHGKVVSVSDSVIDLEETVMDAKGCLTTRLTQLKLVAKN